MRTDRQNDSRGFRGEAAVQGDADKGELPELRHTAEGILCRGRAIRCKMLLLRDSDARRSGQPHAGNAIRG